MRHFLVYLFIGLLATIVSHSDNFFIAADVSTSAASADELIAFRLLTGAQAGAVRADLCHWIAYHPRRRT